MLRRVLAANEQNPASEGSVISLLRRVKDLQSGESSSNDDNALFSQSRNAAPLWTVSAGFIHSLTLGQASKAVVTSSSSNLRHVQNTGQNLAIVYHDSTEVLSCPGSEIVCSFRDFRTLFCARK